MTLRMASRGLSLGSLWCAVLFFGATGPASAAARWPEWADEAIHEVCLECYESEGGVVVLEHWDLKLRAGERRGKMRRVVHVFTEQGRDAAQILLASDSFRRYDKIRVWLRLPDGAVHRFSEEDGTLSSAAEMNILDETRVLHIDPPGLVPGSTVAVESEVFRAADWPQDLIAVQESVPVARLLVSIDAHRGWKVAARVAEGDNPGPSETTGESTWVFNDVPGLPPSWRGLAPLPPTRMLGLSYFPPEDRAPFETWGATARWLHQLFDLPEGRQPRVENLAGNLQGSEEELVRQAGLAARGLRYFAVELGWGGYIPRPPETTLERAFGDCKDKTQVMLALLRQKGIEAFPVLAVAPSHRYVPDGLPGPGHFNHVVTGIPWQDRERTAGMVIVDDPELGPLRLYDSTLPEGSIQDLSLRMHGGTGLVLHPGAGALLRFPGSDPSENGAVEINRYRLEPDGTVLAETTVRTRGVLRWTLEGEDGGPLDPDELRELIFRQLAPSDPEFEILEIENVRQEPDGAWSYSTSYASPKRLADFGELKLLELNSVLPVDMIPTPREDSDVIYLPLLGSFEDRFEVDLGRWRAVTVARPFLVENALGRVQLTVTADDTRLELGRTLTVRSSRIDVDRIDEVLALRSALRQINGTVVIVEAKESDGPEVAEVRAPRAAVRASRGP